MSDLWVSGTTQIDLRGAIDRSGGPVNWATDWLVELDPAIRGRSRSSLIRVLS